MIITICIIKSFKLKSLFKNYNLTEIEFEKKKLFGWIKNLANFSSSCSFATWTKQVTLYEVIALISSIVVDGALTRCVLLHSVYDLRVAQMKVQRSLIGQLMISNWATIPRRQQKQFPRKMKTQIITK